MEKLKLRIVKPADPTPMDSVYINPESFEMASASSLRDLSAPPKAAAEGGDTPVAKPVGLRIVSPAAPASATASDDENVGMSSAVNIADVADPEGDESALIAWEERQLVEMLGRSSYTDDPFENLQVVGNGGMGVLCMARERFLGRDLALKVLIPEHRGDPFLIRQFLREAQITSQLQHPNIPPIYQGGYFPDIGPWYSMRFCEGETLQHIIDRLAADDPAYVQQYDVYRLLDIFQRVCDAVAYAHSQSVIHRDIKPANIMVGRFGDVTLLDWGMAREVGERTQPTIPEPDAGPARRMLKGTPSYMAPEQARGDEQAVRQHTDIFLLGATLYHMFLLTPPYNKPEVNVCLHLARTAGSIPPDSPKYAELTVPPGIVAVIKRCMQPAVEQRYKSVADIIADVDDLLRGKMSFQETFFEKDEVIIGEGDVGDALYYIVSGEVVVYTTNKLGMQKELQRVGPGEIVGELALISDIPRQASVKAVKRTRVRIMNKKDFQQNLQRMEPWVAKLIESLASRLLTANKHNRDMHYRPGFLKW